jgi:D-alanine-D-alanine ligase
VTDRAIDTTGTGTGAARGGSGVTRVSVAVLIGGPSAEHDVSLVSGRAVANALAGRGHPVEGWLIDLDGGWWWLPTAALDLAVPATSYDDPAALGARGPVGAAVALAGLATRVPAPVVFIALHGPFGEDGVVQALCEAAGLAYTGAGVAASAVGMDKSVFKRIAEGLGLPVTPWREVTAADVVSDRASTLGRLAGFARSLPDRRLMVKPACLGSSVGMTIVHHPEDAAELGAALDEALRFDTRALAEAYLDHPRELEVSVVGNHAGDTAVYGPGEVFPGSEFYDYDDKYRTGAARTVVRADLDPALRARIHQIARTAFLAIGARGFARVDFLLLGDALHLNEINTIPGFTPISLFPQVCSEGGYDFAGIAGRIVELAVEAAAARPVARLTRADLP